MCLLHVGGDALAPPTGPCWNRRWWCWGWFVWSSPADRLPGRSLSWSCREMFEHDFWKRLPSDVLLHIRKKKTVRYLFCGKRAQHRGVANTRLQTRNTQRGLFKNSITCKPEKKKQTKIPTDAFMCSSLTTGRRVPPGPEHLGLGIATERQNYRSWELLWMTQNLWSMSCMSNSWNVTGPGKSADWTNSMTVMHVVRSPSWKLSSPEHSLSQAEWLRKQRK